MVETIIIDNQFNGPPNSGHGGYVAGTFADLMEGTAEVTLRSPPPLNRSMTVSRHGKNVYISIADKLVGEVRPGKLQVSIPDCPDRELVALAETRFIEFKKDDFQQCFACGADRDEGDGLRLLTGPIEGSQIVATHWVPHEKFADDNGIIPTRILWSALDCPGVWSIIRDSGVIMLLGRLTAQVDLDLLAGTRCTVIGWPIRCEGRKALAGTAIYDDQGKVRGCAKAVWIKIDKRH